MPKRRQDMRVRVERKARLGMPEPLTHDLEQLTRRQEQRAVIAALRTTGLRYKIEHADHIERLLEQHGRIKLRSTSA